MCYRSPFLNLGLWTVCFHLFRHPKVQFDHLYTGCYSVWGDSLKMIAYWVVPGWMILIQVLATCSLITALTAQLLSISILLRLPLQIVLRLKSTKQNYNSPTYTWLFNSNFILNFEVLLHLNIDIKL